MGSQKIVYKGNEVFDVLDYLVVDDIPSFLLSNKTSHSATNQPMITLKEFAECDCGHQDCWTNKWSAYTPNYDHEIRI